MHRLAAKARISPYHTDDDPARRTGGQTVAEWSELWLAERKRRGLVSTKDSLLGSAKRDAA